MARPGNISNKQVNKMKCPDCGDEYYGLHFCPCKPPRIAITSEMIQKILDWWSKKFRTISRRDKNDG